MSFPPSRRLVVFQLAVSLLAAGCATFEPADPARAAPRTSHPARSIEWPERWTEPVVEYAMRAVKVDAPLGPGYVAWLHYAVGKAPGLADFDSTPLFRGVWGRVTICEVTGGRPRDGAGATSDDPDAPGGPASRPRVLRAAINRYPPEAFAREQAAIDAEGRAGLARQLVNMQEFEVFAPERPAGGVVVAMASWGGQGREEGVRDELLARGWTVVETSLPYESRLRREFELADERDIPPVAREVAALVDQRIADACFGVEGALEFLASEESEAPGEADFGGDLVIVAYSAGTTAAPAVAERLGDRVRGVVLVGGGADLVSMAAGSTFGGQPLRFSWGDDLGDAQDRARLSELYLAASRFDPWHSAATLRSTPVLLLQARHDRLVPPPAGDLLWERLGRPDRWLLPFGHTWLFWRLPGYAETIADWLEARAARRE